MKRFQKWRILFSVLSACALIALIVLAFQGQWISFGILLVLSLCAFFMFLSFWQDIRRKGLQCEVEVSRVLGKDAKDALIFAETGIITYNSEYEVTWMSDYLRSLHLDLVNRKLTAFLPQIRDLFDGHTDKITGKWNGMMFEVHHKRGAQVLFVRNVTDTTDLETRLSRNSLVLGLMTLDNYSEYQSYDNEEIINEVNTRLRPLISSWAKEHQLFMRRLRSDRYLLILDSEILDQMRQQNFSILQRIKDHAAICDLNITLSIVFAQNQESLPDMDRTLNELLELVESRGGDQIAIKNGNEPIEYIGGNSEKSSVRSKVRVHVVGSSIQDLIRDASRVFVLGHVNTDYDAMGAALAVDNWVRTLNRESFIVLKDVPRDEQLSQTLQSYSNALYNRHTFITEEQALMMFDPKKDLLIMVDHSNPDISSGKRLLTHESGRTIIIDHHRRSESYPPNVLVSYIESSASSTAELITELLQSSSLSIPIYELEATILYLGLLVDTARFKQHTSERTFQAAATLRSWGANVDEAERSLQEDYSDFKTRVKLIENAQPFMGRYLIDVIDYPVSRTLLSQVSDSLLKFKGCEAAFTIGVNENTGNVAVSARSDGSINVQRIMEQMDGGGHFSAAALERPNSSIEEVKIELESLIEKEENDKRLKDAA